MNDESTPVTDSFPDKPEFEKDDNTLIKSIGSIALFIITFYLYFEQDIKYVLLLVVVLFIHEMGHFIAMKYFRYNDVKMFFIPLLGAYVRGDKQEISQRERAIILLAGPVPGIIIGVLLYILWLKTGVKDVRMAAYIFVVINAFNLLPLSPLDGGNLISTLFMSSKQRVQTVFAALSAIGLTIIAIYLKSYILLIVPYFLVLRNYMQSKIRKLKIVLDEKGIDYNKPFEELTGREYWLIRDEVISNKVAFSKLTPGDYTPATREKQMAAIIRSLYTRKTTANLGAGAKAAFATGWLLCLAGPVLGIAMIYYSNTGEKLISPEYRNKAVQECMTRAGEGAIKYPVEMKEYCECATDKVLKLYANGTLKNKEGATPEELYQLYLPYINNCVEDLRAKIRVKEFENSADTSRLQ